MPSKDTFHEKNPQVNDWMEREGVSSAQAKRSATGGRAPGATASRTVRRATSAQVQRLARRLGSDPDELASKIPADTLRRTQYPVIEVVDEQGYRHFKHDTGIKDDGRIALVRK